MPNIKIIKQNKQLYLLNKQEKCEFNEKLFDPHWLKSEGLLFGEATGRTKAFIFYWQSRLWVLKRYRRGGLPAKISESKYWFSGLKRTRVYKEMALLIELHKKHLPVSNPWIARVVRQNMTYQSEIITEYIPESKSLADYLKHDPLLKDQWQKVGAAIAQLHQHHVDHADLNARNILFSHGKVFFIDFDRSKIKKGHGWKKRNLQRLKRSILKIQRNTKEWFFFNDEDWQFLIDAYYAVGNKK